MPIAHKLDLNMRLVGLTFFPGFAPAGRLHLSLPSRSREDIKDLFGFIGSNQLEQPGMKHTSESPPSRSPGTRSASPLPGNTPHTWGCCRSSAALAPCRSTAAYFCPVTHLQQHCWCTGAARAQVSRACQVPTPHVPSCMGGRCQAGSSMAWVFESRVGA